MKLTRYTDYSLRVLIYVALHEGRRITISEISDKFMISKNHLVKVVHGLSSEGFLTTFRGRSGGICLARPASKIIVGDIIRVTEGRKNVLECNKPACAIRPACKLEGVFLQASEAFLSVLDEFTIKDLVQNKEELLQLVG
jgi:Rrf2 family transcriptional regulator, nitric oxide-sensitive transcriptional repressor